jgi:hypothetical protein
VHIGKKEWGKEDGYAAGTAVQTISCCLVSQRREIKTTTISAYLKYRGEGRGRGAARMEKHTGIPGRGEGGAHAELCQLRRVEEWPKTAVDDTEWGPLRKGRFPERGCIWSCLFVVGSIPREWGLLMEGALFLVGSTPSDDELCSLRRVEGWQQKGALSKGCPLGRGLFLEVTLFLLQEGLSLQSDLSARGSIPRAHDELGPLRRVEERPWGAVDDTEGGPLGTGPFRKEVYGRGSIPARVYS